MAVVIAMMLWICVRTTWSELDFTGGVLELTLGQLTLLSQVQGNCGSGDDGVE